MMSAFKISPKARLDLEGIWQYTLMTWGEKQAETYIRQLNDGFRLLAQEPETGRDAGYIREGYRKFPVGRHVIYYLTASEGGILIVRVLHERMDVDRHLLE